VKMVNICKAKAYKKCAIFATEPPCRAYVGYTCKHVSAAISTAIDSTKLNCLHTPYRSACCVGLCLPGLDPL